MSGMCFSLSRLSRQLSTEVSPLKTEMAYDNMWINVGSLREATERFIKTTWNLIVVRDETLNFGPRVWQSHTSWGGDKWVWSSGTAVSSWKSQNSERILLQNLFVHYLSHLKLPGIEPESPMWEETICLPCCAMTFDTDLYLNPNRIKNTLICGTW